MFLSFDPSKRKKDKKNQRIIREPKSQVKVAYAMIGVISFLFFVVLVPFDFFRVNIERFIVLVFLFLFCRSGREASSSPRGCARGKQDCEFVSIRQGPGQDRSCDDWCFSFLCVLSMN